MEEPEVLRNSAIGMLKELGLTTREAEIYLTILQRGKVTMKDLVEALDIHQPQLYNVLASLARKGLVRVSVGRPKVYIANDPRSVVETRIAQLEALGRGIEECLNRIKKYRGDIEHAAYISVVRGQTGVEAALLELVSSTREELCCQLPLKLLKKYLENFLGAISRGVTAYLLVFPGVDEEVVSALREYGNVKLREVRLGDFLLAVADASAAVYVRRRFMSELRPLPLQDIYGYVIQERDLIWRLMYIFDRTWPRAREVLSWDVDRRSYPRSFLVFARALEELERLLNAGYRPLVKVEGYMVKTGEEVTLTGVASSVRLSEEVTAFVLESGGTRYSVGGFDAELEDVEATRVTIIDITK